MRDWTDAVGQVANHWLDRHEIKKMVIVLICTKKKLFEEGSESGEGDWEVGYLGFTLSDSQNLEYIRVEVIRMRKGTKGYNMELMK